MVLGVEDGRGFSIDESAALQKVDVRKLVALLIVRVSKLRRLKMAKVAGKVALLSFEVWVYEADDEGVDVDHPSDLHREREEVRHCLGNVSGQSGVRQGVNIPQMLLTTDRNKLGHVMV